MLSLSTALSIKQRFLEQALKQSQSRTQGLKMAARVNRNETDIVIIQNKLDQKTDKSTFCVYEINIFSFWLTVCNRGLNDSGNEIAETITLTKSLNFIE